MCTYSCAWPLPPSIPRFAETIRSIGQSDEQMMRTLGVCMAEHLHEKHIEVHEQSLIRYQLWGTELLLQHGMSSLSGQKAITTWMEKQPSLTFIPLALQFRISVISTAMGRCKNPPKHWRQQAMRLLRFMSLKS